MLRTGEKLPRCMWPGNALAVSWSFGTGGHKCLEKPEPSGRVIFLLGEFLWLWVKNRVSPKWLALANGKVD